MAKKLTKEELRTPDIFISTSEQLYRYLERHTGTIIGLLVCVMVGLAGWGVYSYVNSRREKAAVEALYPAQRALDDVQSKIRDERAAIMKKEIADSKSKKNLKLEEARPVDYAKDYAPVVDSFETAIKANAGTRAAMIAAMNLSYFLIQQKQFPKALEVLDVIRYHPGSGDLLQGFWLMHRGLSLMENKQVDLAIGTYQQLIHIDGLKAFWPQAILKLGLCYQMKGQLDKARQNYETLTREYPQTEASNSAREYLRLLNLNAKPG